MTENTGSPHEAEPVTPDDQEHEVGHARDGWRWDGTKWVLAGAEGTTSVENPPHHDASSA